DRRLLGTGGDQNLIGATVSGDGTTPAGTARGVVGAVVLNDVVLDERVLGPTVDGKVRVAVGLVGTRVGDGPGSTRVPTARIVSYENFIVRAMEILTPYHRPSYHRCPSEC